MVGSTVVFTHNIFFISVCRKKDWFLNKFPKNWVSLVTSHLPSNCWDVFGTNILQKQSETLFVQIYQNRKEVPCKEESCFNDSKTRKKDLLRWKYHVTMVKKEAFIGNLSLLQNGSLPFSLGEQNTSFSKQCTIYTIKFHSSQHYRFHRQANLYQLRRLSKISRQIWAFFLLQKRLQLIRCKTHSLLESWQERFLLV